MAINQHIQDPGLAAVLELAQQAHEQALELCDLVAQVQTPAGVNGSGSAGEELLLEQQAQLSKQIKVMHANLAQLRGQHRAAQFAARKTKADTADYRQEVDRLHLQLSNLFYEQRHLEGEIAACELFEHKYQQLPMIPVEEFLALHPEHAEADENDLMVARINHERAAREALEQTRVELVKRKQKLIAENKKRSDDLANLDKNLEKFIDGGQPIQKLFEKVV